MDVDVAVCCEFPVARCHLDSGAGAPRQSAHSIAANEHVERSIPFFRCVAGMKLLPEAVPVAGRDASRESSRHVARGWMWAFR